MKDMQINKKNKRVSIREDLNTISYFYLSYREKIQKQNIFQQIEIKKNQLKLQQSTSTFRIGRFFISFIDC